ncbi:MAG: glycosyltransferase 87 family protein [Bacteroidota bacterium]
MRAAFTTYRLPAGIALLSAILYYVFAYRLARTDFTMLITLYGVLFFLCCLLIQFSGRNTTFLVGIGLVFRILFLFAIPNLSQDFYRFIWDGELLLKGMSPYLYKPDDLVQNSEFSIPNMQELYNGMGTLSASHYSNYPPLNQVIFAMASIFSNKITGMVIAMRILLITADMGVLYFGKKLLRYLKLPQHHIFWYFLNPFILIELTGNLHFEGVMLCFLLWSLYVLFRHKTVLAAVLFACAVSIKLIPLLFLPLFLQRLGWKKMMIHTCIVLLTTCILFLPFISGVFLTHYSETIGLWFVNFEFNASWYYVVRSIGFEVKGYNIIHSYAKVMPWIVLSVVLYLAFFRKNKTPVQLLTAMLLALSFYYFTATTVHPWYITLLIGLSVFTTYNFPLVWSGLIMLSYYAYAHIPFHENMWLIGLEYLPVYGMMLWEIWNRTPLLSPVKWYKSFSNRIR